MIIDSLTNSSFYKQMGSKWETVFDYLKACTKAFPAPGEYEIDGRKIYASIQQYTTSTEDKRIWEAHKKYIDIQYVFEGDEAIGYTPVGNMINPTEYNNEKDCILANTVNDSMMLYLHSGEFAVFFPQDAHKPRCSYKQETNVKKVVVKVLLEK